MRPHYSLLSCVLLPLLACGGGGGGGGGTVDAPHGGSGIDAPGSAACTAASTYSGAPTAAMAQDQVNPATGSGSDAVPGDEFEEYIGNVDATTQIDVQLYSGTSDYPGDTLTPLGSKNLGGSDDSDYATCGTCVQLFAGEGSDGTPTAGYLATSGTLNISSAKGTFTATLTGAGFVQVDINPNTFESTPDPSGCTSDVASMTLSATVSSGSGSAAGPEIVLHPVGHGQLPPYMIHSQRSIRVRR